MPVMQVQRAYRVQLDPTRDQAEALARHAGAARAAYNHALAAKVAAHQQWRQDVAWATYQPEADPDPVVAEAAARKSVKVAVPSFVDNVKTFKADPRHAWYPEVNTYAISSGARRADAAWRNWLESSAGRRKGRRVGYPRFKRKGRTRDSFTLFHDVKKPTLRPDGYRRLNLPKRAGGSIRLKGHIRQLARRIRRETAVIASVTISRHGHRWIASILARETITIPDKPTPTQRRGGPVGVDVGVKHLAALSTGEHVPNPRAGAKLAAQLRRAQRALARTQWRRERDDALVTHPKGQTRCAPTAGRRRAQARVARLQTLLAEQRAQTLHRLTKRLATGHDLIAVEDLNVAGMTRSARGTLDQPGRNVRAKAGLNREILDVAFGELRRQLEYKTSWYGSQIALAPRFAPTSQTCATCGWRDTSLTLAQRELNCPRCGPVDRDLNAARAILLWATGQTPPVAPEKEETKNARGEQRPPTNPSAGPNSQKREGPPQGGHRGPGNEPPVPPQTH